jgi:aconitate hydratase
MLAIGAGGIDVAMAMAGEPFYLKMPKIWGVKLSDELPDWVSAKDAILEMLRRHDVDGGIGCILEYYGPGLNGLSAMDRHVIANMGAELGATSTVFPSDEAVRSFLERQGRGDDWVELSADPDASYDQHDEIDLSTLEPLIALPSSPGKVVPVREVAGREIYQAYIGSSANPGYRDFAVAAKIVTGRKVADQVSFDINPTSRQLLGELIESGLLQELIQSGARLHQAGCNGCIGMGQAPASGRISLRTVPRNFPGRSGTKEDSVYLCSPETAAASALKGVITDPRQLEFAYPKVALPQRVPGDSQLLVAPLEPEKAQGVELVKGPNIASLPELDPLPDELALPVLLKLGDDVSTDEIMPAGARVLPFRSNIPRISEFVFEGVDPAYVERAKERRESGGHAIVAGENYGQGSSREHAAIAPRHLGLGAVIAKEFARIHCQNLVNFGVLPLTFKDPADYNRIDMTDMLVLSNLRSKFRQGENRFEIPVTVKNKGFSFVAIATLTHREVAVVLTGGLTNWIREAQHNS